MMYQSEAQFLDGYGGRGRLGGGRFSEGAQNRYFGNKTGGEGDSMWDKLSRLFTFGCIETNHNYK